MGQVLHGSARTTAAIRRALQRSEESVRALARRYGISPTTVQKWRKRGTTADRPMGPSEPKSTVLSLEQEAMIVAFRRHTLLPLDDCLYALQPSIPGLTRSSLHRCLQRHGISRLPDLEGDKPEKRKFKVYPIGFFHMERALARYWSEDHGERRGPHGRGQALPVRGHRPDLQVRGGPPLRRGYHPTACQFLEELLAVVTYRIHTLLTDRATRAPSVRARWRGVSSSPSSPGTETPSSHG